MYFASFKVDIRIVALVKHKVLPSLAFRGKIILELQQFE